MEEIHLAPGGEIGNVAWGTSAFNAKSKGTNSGGYADGSNRGCRRTTCRVRLPDRSAVVGPVAGRTATSGSEGEEGPAT